MKSNSLYWVLCLAAFVSCQQLYQKQSDKEEVKGVAIARVGSTYLYQDELIDLVPLGSSKEDSTRLIDKYLDQWVKKQLTINRASQELQFDEAKIDRKVLDYRYALMVHEYEKYYVNQHLKKEIKEEEINKYYSEKFENFVLRQNIVRCLFAIIPKEAPQLKKFKKQIKSYPNGNLEEIQSYCYRFATKSSLESDLWLPFDEVMTGVPEEIDNKVKYLKNHSYIETSDEENYYFIRLLDYKIANQISPLEYIRDDIESILINRKKVELRKQLDLDIMTRAKENNEFEIY